MVGLRVAGPTIDAGSNALVPSGVTTDFYGVKREAATGSCRPRVDIGAAEFQALFVFCGNPIGVAKVIKEKARP